MISRVRGELLSLDLERVELLAASGVVYEVHLPITVFHRLPPVGSQLELLTAYIVRDDVPSLYGFLEAHERTLFFRLLTVQMVGPRLALAMMSAYHSGRLARAIAEKDTRALVQVSGLGKKTAERVVLELADKVADIAVVEGRDGPEAKRAAEAVAALTGLGYTFTDADAAVRDATRTGDPGSTEELVRSILAQRSSGRD